MPWISTHLYYQSPWEDLLTKGIFPFVQTLLQKKEISQYFFIRYWENGPHIRLRLKGNPTILKPKIKAYFQTFFQKNPSKSTHSEIDWQPNNTVVFTDYEPELERYGGKENIHIAEQHFFDSSQTVLTILKEGQPWDYDNGLQIGLVLHLSFIYSLGFSKTSSIPLLQVFFKTWLSTAYKAYPKERIEEQFAVIHEEQKDMLRPFLEQLWSDMEQGILFEETWLNHWIAQCKKLRLAYENTYSLSITKKMEIYRSLMHLTNNRLGVLNQDEPFLAFLLLKGLS